MPRNYVLCLLINGYADLLYLKGVTVPRECNERGSVPRTGQGEVAGRTLEPERIQHQVAGQYRSCLSYSPVDEAMFNKLLDNTGCVKPVFQGNRYTKPPECIQYRHKTFHGHTYFT